MVESKLFQLVIDEGGRYFSLRIFERGKFFMNSVFFFFVKNVAQWLMTNIEPHHYVVGGSGHSKFTAQPHKCNSKIQNSKTFFETVKRHQLHISDRKQAQQLGNTDEGKLQSVGRLAVKTPHTKKGEKKK